MRASILGLLGFALPFVQGHDESAPGVSGRPTGNQHLRRCTVDDLLPGLGEGFESRWVPLGGNEKRSREYDCSCPYFKARYYCPNGHLDYPPWTPRAVVDQECAGRDMSIDHPFPAGTKILFYGNSHIRQVVESIMCLYAENIVRRKSLLYHGIGFNNATIESVPLDYQCRGVGSFIPSEMTVAGCLSPEVAKTAFRCSDDRAVFDFTNGATVHFSFAGTEVNKSLEYVDGLGTSATDYDVVVANCGNNPRLPTARVITAAQQLHEAGVAFLWLSTFSGRGNLELWSPGTRNAFATANGKYLAVNRMMKGVKRFTVGAVEQKSDEHFCLPGPPNELGLLVLQLIWALHDEHAH